MLAAVIGMFLAAPAPAALVALAYDAVGYAYDGSSLSPSTANAATNARRSPEPPGAISWGRAAVVGGDGVAAKTEASVATRVAETGMNNLTGTTVVLMADGSKKPIKDIKLGDWVIAKNPTSGEQHPEQVLRLIRHSGPHTMVAVHLAGGTTIDATDRHPFWVSSRGAWLDAVDLMAGDAVETAGGQRLMVTGVGIRAEDLTAFNLSVANLHTYFAGQQAVLVHDAGCTSMADLPADALRKLTTNENYAFSRLAENHGVTRIEFGDQIHAIKRANDLPGDFNLTFGPRER